MRPIEKYSGIYSHYVEPQVAMITQFRLDLYFSRFNLYYFLTCQEWQLCKKRALDS